MNEQTKMQRTPGPWMAAPTAGHELHGQSVVYSEASGRDIAIVYDGRANAEFIARACNAYEELIAVLEKAKARIRWYAVNAEGNSETEPDTDDVELIAEINVVLANAQGETE